jgi:hypothetical protein
MELIQMLTVFGLSLIELWAAIPAGFVFNLNPVVIIIATSSGAILSALLVVLAGDKIRNKIIKWRYGEKKDNKQSRLHQVWNKYGVIGLGLLSPLLFGAPLGAALGTMFGAQKWRLLFWMSLGIVFWSVGLTIAGVVGIGSIESFTR